MARFRFGLQKVLDYRELTEDWAKTAYLEAQVRRMEAEAVLSRLRDRRRDARCRASAEPHERDAFIAFLQRLQDDERAQEAALAVLRFEEERAQAAWIEARKEAESLRKLRERKKLEFDMNQIRLEQAELDEWSVLRREAA